MAYDWLVVPQFGGGLDLSSHPAFIEAHRWSWSNGWIAQDGTAMVDVGYEQISDGSWLPATNACIGIVADLFADANVLLVCANTSTSVVRLFRMNLGGASSEITVSGTAPHGAISMNNSGVIVPTLLNGLQVLHFGTTGAGTYSMATYDGTNFARIAPTMALRARFAVAAQGYLIAAHGGAGSPTASDRRSVYVSDANDPTTWDPDISNSADNFTLDSPGVIRALCATTDGALIITSSRTYRMRSTGGIPPFTVAVEHEGGDLHHDGHAVGTPYGYLYSAGTELFLNGSPVPSWRRVAGIANRADVNGSYPRKYLWHPTRRAAIVPYLPTGLLSFDPVQDVYWRHVTPASVSDQTITTIGVTIPLTSTNPPRHVFVTSAGVVYREEAPGSSSSDDDPFAGAFVDTKDFTFGSPPLTAYVTRIKVDWEPLNNAATDAIVVSAYMRDALSAGILGSSNMSMDLSSAFVTVGTLTGGASELPVALKGKFCRLRFTQSSGRARIRGFSIRWEAANDKTGAA